MTSPNWGDFWMVVVGPDGRTYLGEHVGMATLVQVQLMLENGTLASDTVPGYGALGANRTRADGVWGQQTLRQLYAYVNANASAIGLSDSFKNTVLSVILSDIRASRISDTVVYAAFVLAFMRPRAIRRQTDMGIQRSVSAPLVSLGSGSNAGTMTSGDDPRFVTFLQRLPFPADNPQILTVPPRFVVMDANFPPPPYDVAQLAQADGFVVPGSNNNAPPGPYTLRQGESSPIQLPGTANAPRTSPQIGQIVGFDGPPAPISVPTPPPPVPGQPTSILPPKPTYEILVPTFPSLPTTPGVTTPSVPSNPQQPSQVQDGIVPAPEAAPPAEPPPVGVLAKSAAAVDKALPVAGALVLGTGLLIFVGLSIQSSMKAPQPRRLPPTRPPQR